MPPLTEPGAKEEQVLPAWCVLGSLVLIAGLYFLLHRHDLTVGWLEDLPIYKAALHAYMQGVNPYAVTHRLMHFVYPPIVLACISFLARIMPGESEWVLIIGIHIMCVLAAPLVLASYYLRRPWLTPAMALLIWLAEPLYTGVRALFSANIAPSLYLFALLAAIPGIRRNRWYWFYVVVFLAGMVKATMILLLLFPLLAGTQQWLPSTLTVVAVAAINKVQQMFMPGFYADYKASLLQQVTGLRMYGYGVFGTAAVVEQKVHHDQVGISSYAVHILFAVILLAFLFLLRRRGANALRIANATPDAAVLWLGLIVMGFVMVNPRVLHYDIYLALFAAFVVLATTLRLHGWKLLLLLLLLFLPGLLALPHSRPWLVPQTWQLLIVLTALAAGIRRLWLETQPAIAPGLSDPALAVARES
jgi:hypothetical protein